MYKVRVIGPGVKLANKWCYINDEAIIDEKELEKNKEYVEVIEKIEEPKEPTIPENPNPDGDEKDGSDTNDGTNDKGENSGDNQKDDNEAEEMEALKEKAKELGINVTHNMKKETIIKKIEEAEAKAGENPNPDGE